MTEGQRLPSEQSLANAYGVSRPVVREALARLRADGIIVSRHGSGSYVRHQPATDFMRLAPIGGVADLLRAYEYRAAIEGEVAWLAAERRTEADLAVLSKALKEMQRALEEREIGAEADMRFHRGVAAATKNPLFDV